MSTLDDRLGAALGGIPRLPGAACTGLHNVMDATDDPQPALEICATCRVYEACRQFADEQGDNLVGIVAGEVYLHRSDRRRKASA